MEAEAGAIVVCQSVGVQTGALPPTYPALPSRYRAPARAAWKSSSAGLLSSSEGITPEDGTDGSIAAWSSKPQE